MTETEREVYVRAALAAQGYRFPRAQTAEIVRQFERIETIAAAMLDVELPLATEPAPVFRP